MTSLSQPLSLPDKLRQFCFHEYENHIPDSIWDFFSKNGIVVNGTNSSALKLPHTKFFICSEYMKDTDSVNFEVNFPKEDNGSAMWAVNFTLKDHKLTMGDVSKDSYQDLEKYELKGEDKLNEIQELVEKYLKKEKELETAVVPEAQTSCCTIL